MSDIASSEELVAIRMGEEFHVLLDRERGSHQHLATVYEDDGDLVVELHRPRVKTLRLRERADDLSRAGDPLRVCELVVRFALLR
jgi:hypothetical protein